MPNTIKYGTEIENNTLKKGNFVIGVNNVDYGPTNETGYHNTITPPEGGYVVYKNRGDNERSIYVAESDEELVLLKDDFGATGTTANDILVWAAQQSDVIILNNPLDNIVTDGLVLYLDAGFTCSYPKSNTTWYDLSGNGNNGTLTNGPTFSGGSIVFDGVDDYAPLGGSTPTSLRGNSSFTVEGWFKRSGDWSGGATWGIGGDNGRQGINSWNSNRTNQISIDLWGTSTYSTGETYSTTEWKHCVWTYNGISFTTSNIIIYVNTVAYTGGSLITLRGGTGIPNINSNGLVLSRAGRNSDNYYGKPIISNFRIYNKVLTSSEVLQNYNAQKSRFGL